MVRMPAYGQGNYNFIIRHLIRILHLIIHKPTPCSYLGICTENK